MMNNCGKCVYKEIYKNKCCCTKDRYCKRIFKNSMNDYYTESKEVILLSPNYFLFEEISLIGENCLDIKLQQSIVDLNKIKEYAIGYCDGKDMIWCREFDYAFLFEKEGRRFWFHIPKSSKVLEGIII